MPNFKSFDAFVTLRKMHDSEDAEELLDSLCQKILQNCWVEHLRKGEYVCYEGDKGDKFYIILQGSVQFLSTNHTKTQKMMEMRRQMLSQQQSENKSHTPAR